MESQLCDYGMMMESEKVARCRERGRKFIKQRGARYTLRVPPTDVSGVWQQEIDRKRVVKLKSGGVVDKCTLSQDRMRVRGQRLARCNDAVTETFEVCSLWYAVTRSNAGEFARGSTACVISSTLQWLAREQQGNVAMQPLKGTLPMTKAEAQNHLHYYVGSRLSRLA